MRDIKMDQENIAYALGQLAGFEPSDIECDDFDIAVNDDQFAAMSIVRLAALASESQDDLIRENGGLSETVKKLLIENLDKAKDNDRMVEEIAELREHLANLVTESISLAQFKNDTLRKSICSTDTDEPEWHDHQAIGEAGAYLENSLNKND